MAKILCMIDSFKGTLTSLELGQITKDILTNKGHDVDFIPISDGGEGFLDAVECIHKTKRISLKVNNPLFEMITSDYCYSETTRTAYIEMAQSSGLLLISNEMRNPKISSTYGLGEMIKHAVNLKANKIVIGIGGSATNDGGAGMLEALGVRFLNANNEPIHHITPIDFHQIDKIDIQEFKKIYNHVDMHILSDVTNPLLGLNGATYIYGKQKGATHIDQVLLEDWMNHYATKLSDAFQNNQIDKACSGAAGGVGFALRTAFKHNLMSGIDQILNWIDYENLSKAYDYVFTGEGKIDEQSLNGKVILGIANQTKQAKVIFSFSNQ